MRNDNNGEWNEDGKLNCLLCHWMVGFVAEKQKKKKKPSTKWTKMKWNGIFVALWFCDVGKIVHSEDHLRNYKLLNK